MGPGQTGRASELGGSSRRRRTPTELGEELVAVSRGVVEDRWRVALVVVLVLAGLTLPAGVASAQFPGNYTMVVDQGGANDVNSSQVDLTQFGRDDSDPNRYKLLWSWDATDDWTGTGATGDACALFDGDGDGRVNFAVCARIQNPAGTRTRSCRWSGSPYAYTCTTRARPLRPADLSTIAPGTVNSGAIDLLTGAILPSPPANLITRRIRSATSSRIRTGRTTRRSRSTSRRASCRRVPT